MQNKIPLGVAIDIAKAEGGEAQRELLKAYESGQANQFSLRAMRRVIEQRRLLGKKRARGGKEKAGRQRTAWSMPIGVKSNVKMPLSAKPEIAKPN